MDDLGSFWTFQENVDALKQKVEYMTYELEVTRKETNEEIRRSNDHIKKLLQLLQTTCKERDDAKAQLNKLQQILAFNKPPNHATIDHELIVSAPFATTPFSPDSPLLSTFPARANSGLTESNSFSQTQSQSHVSSPVVDSLSYTTPVASSPDSSNIGFSGNTFATTKVANNTSCTTTTTTTTTTTPINIAPAPTKVVDQGTLVIETLAKGRPRPQQGKLLQAVLEAGPLLQTLMVAGSLPQWRNPPGLLTHQIPPVNLKGCDGVGLMSQSNKQVLYGQIANGSMGICASPMLDFGSGSSLVGGRMMSSPVSFDCQSTKRQRIL